MKRAIGIVAAAVVGLVACHSTDSSTEYTPAPAPPIDAASLVDARPDVSFDEPSAHRYPDDVKLHEVHALTVHATAAFSGTLDPASWIVETLPKEWKVIEIARRDVPGADHAVHSFILVRWEPMAKKNEWLTGWVPAENVVTVGAADASLAAVTVADAGPRAACPDGSTGYGALRCATTCFTARDCARTSRCVGTEPARDGATGICLTEGGLPE